MNRHFDSELQELKISLLAMGGAVEKAIEEACSAVIRREPHRFQEVHKLEKSINEQDMKIDEAALNLMARQAPVAKDLRLILAIVKINADLERMGDQAVNIAYAGDNYLKQPAVKIMPDIGQMAIEVKAMVKDSLDAFVRRDVDLSHAVLERDDSVDRMNASIRQLLKGQMRENPECIDAAMDLIGVARNLERLADHATNIAEEVIFLTTGEDIRHGHVPAGT